MPILETQVTLWPTSNLQADASTNTWTFAANSAAEYVQVHDAIKNFYIGIRPSLPNLVRQEGHTIKSYDRAAAPPRVPILETTFDFIGAPSGAALPPEVALCLSFQGLALGGAPQSRRRGRVYIGPLRQDNVGTDARPTAGLITSLRDAALSILAAQAAGLGWYWGVYSTVNNSVVAVTNGWIDNEFDTQRRRGRRRTARTTFT